MRVETVPIIETSCSSRIRWMCSRVLTTDAYVSEVQKTEVHADPVHRQDL